MLRFPQRLVLSGVACALMVGLALAAWGLATGSSGAQAGTMHNCPPAGKWSIAVWDGSSGAAAADALATCGPGAVDAAYSLDPQTGGWLRWFAGKPEASNMPPFNEMQGVLALRAATGPAPTPTPSATPTPALTPGTAGDVVLVSSNAFSRTMAIKIDGEDRELTVVGELRNDSSADRSAGEITIRFYDAAGQMVGVRKTYGFDDVIRPGRTTAFRESLPSLLYWTDETNHYPEGWTRYEIALSPREPSEWEAKPVDMAVENVQVADGGLQVTGNAVNAGSKTVDKYGVHVYVIYYRADGAILNAGQDYGVNDEPLGPGQSVAFDISFSDDEPVEFTAYVVQAYAEAE